MLKPAMTPTDAHTNMNNTYCTIQMYFHTAFSCKTNEKWDRFLTVKGQIMCFLYILHIYHAKSKCVTASFHNIRLKRDDGVSLTCSSREEDPKHGEEAFS